MIKGQVPHCGSVKLLGAEEEGTTLDILVIWAVKATGAEEQSTPTTPQKQQNKGATTGGHAVRCSSKRNMWTIFGWLNRTLYIIYVITADDVNAATAGSPCQVLSKCIFVPAAPAIL